MLKQNLLLFLRHMRKSPAISMAGIAALVLGLGCWLITWVFVQDELSYDRYHHDLDRLYRVAVTFQSASGGRSYARIAQPIAPVLKENFPEVQTVARILSHPAYPLMVRCGQKAFLETGVLAAEPDLLRILTISFLQGDPATALEQPGTVALTRSMATKYFGTENPMGQALVIHDQPMKITAVLADAPVNTHLPYQFIVSLKGFAFGTDQWFQTDVYTYLKLAPGVNAAVLAKKIARLTRQYGPADPASERLIHSLQPVKDIHLYSKLQNEPNPPGHLAYVQIAMLLGFLTLVIATLNFANLLIARSSARSQEIGVRKTIGAQRNELQRQFILEALSSAFLSLFLAILTAVLALPLVNSMLDKHYSLTRLLSLQNLAVGLGVALLSGICAGAYPAIFLSRLAPGPLLKKDRIPVSGKARLHRLLLTLQFVVSIAFIIFSLTISHQLHFMKTRELGFAQTQKLVLSTSVWPDLQTQTEAVKTAFTGHSAIMAASFSSDIPGREMGTFGTRLEQNNWDKVNECYYLFVDTDFVNQYQIRLEAGRPFQRDLVSDRNGCLINQAAVKALGFPSASAALDRIIVGGNDDNRMRIIGVVGDFHYQGLHTEVKPLVLELLDSPFGKNFSRPNYLSLTIDTRQTHAVLSFLEKQWQRSNPQNPFGYFFLDDDFNRQYAQDERAGLLAGTLTVLAIFIACCGLFGMMVFASQRMRKELSIRKILGASTLQVAGRLNRQFLWLLLGANLLAWPLAYWAAVSWLKGFAYRIAPSPAVFIASTLIIMVSSLLTVGVQTLRTARTNPVENIRCE